MTSKELKCIQTANNCRLEYAHEKLEKLRSDKSSVPGNWDNCGAYMAGITGVLVKNDVCVC